MKILNHFFSFQKIFEKYNSDELEYLKFLLSGTSKKKILLVKIMK